VSTACPLKAGCNVPCSVRIAVATPYLLTISYEYGRKVPFQDYLFLKIQAHRIPGAA
jgi:hypothetical protein